MHPTREKISGRRKRPPPLPLPDTFRIHNLEFPIRNNLLEKLHGEYTPKNQPQDHTLEWRNNPHPRHARCIQINTKYLREPICYMETEDTKTKQDHWWPTCEPIGHHPTPPYDKKSTQRSDFQKPSCLLSRPVKHTSKPTRGIVPLACPRTPTSLPRIFQEQLSFKHHYDARATPCVPYQGKKCGTFVWTEITPRRERTQVLPSTQGSGPLEQPKTEEGNSAESCLTSPSLRLPDSQETLDSGTHLSKTNASAGAKANPSSSERRQESSGISQSTQAQVRYPPGEMPPKPLRKRSLDTLQDHLPPLHKTAIARRNSDCLEGPSQ
ncbi:uncharacterized protein C2orf73 homolog [Hemicordylus capensis]|uniref:uncharacterized protein C2orf73 homolog n=1 Tax=Hemicordylus capensis TaxID=884348 RepID=UPI0023039A3E|nr:uncharacterized protein C2orf73 homolog [Hemicordylus capensis]